jgi:hypothetical protein
MRFRAIAVALPFLFAAQLASAKAPRSIAVAVTPAATAQQLVRISLPLPKNFVHDGQTLEASNGRQRIPVGFRALTWHPTSGGERRSVRRALVTFPWSFRDRRAVSFDFRPVMEAAGAATTFPSPVTVEKELVTISYPNGPTVRARLVAPARADAGEWKCETIESNAFYLWQRFHLPDPQWPRVVEVRVDALGGVMVQAHLRRDLAGDGRAPDFGWNFEIISSHPDGACRLEEGGDARKVDEETLTHPFTEGKACALVFDTGAYRLRSPTASFKRRGKFIVRRAKAALFCRYLACEAAERVPMQQAAWRRAEFVVAPANLAPLTPALESSHDARVDWQLLDELYDTGRPLDLSRQPELKALLRYHHDATVRSAAVGDDWGNVTGYNDALPNGGIYGMNRLNHCAAIFEEGYRSGDRRLLETAVLWCENFYDQSIWWGPGETGGTRYNNMIAQNQTPPDNDRNYMWRSDSAVSFCTKGYDAFFYAWEQTGDPRMKEALEAQLAYAAKHLDAGRNYTRNVVDVRDFLRLYSFTGDARFLKEAKRLFGELRTQLSTGDLFTESGLPILSVLPFIENDAIGYKSPYAKPYIIGYALAGLPELARLTPDEPKLREVVRTVSDFLVTSQDPVGGWRYPHPRSSMVIVDQAMEHAWQLVQANRWQKPDAKHLDAIERVLRQRLLVWRKTGKLFSRLTGWEVTTGRVKDAAELNSLYAHPADRDLARDYTEGRGELGSGMPEGIVYFPEVLAFYLKHRPAARLLAPAREDEPLGKVLARIPSQPLAGK